MRRWYLVGALGLLAAADSFQVYAFAVLAPDIARSLGIGAQTVAAIALLGLLAVPLGALAVIAIVRGGRHRALASVLTGAAWSAGTALTALVTGPWGLVAIIAGDGATTASVRTLHPALIADAYSEHVRVRALGAHRALDALGLVIAPLLVAGLIAAGLTWRGVFLVLGAASALAVLAALGLRDPGTPGAVATGVQPTVLEQCRALLRVPTVRRLLATGAVLGVMLAPLLGHLLFFLEHRFGLGPMERGPIIAAAGAATIVAVAVLAPAGERRLRRGPAALAAVAPPLFVILAAALAALVLAPAVVWAAAALAAVLACIALVSTLMLALLMTIVAPAARPHAGALTGIATAGIGGITGLLLLTGIDEALGTTGSVLSLALPALAAGAVVRGAATTADDDMSEMLAMQQQREDLARRRSSGAREPLLACRSVAHAYDGRPALADIDLVVEQGELVAVLGTNGAGKSTLLRLIAGLEPLARGAIRLDGEDVQLLGPERRVGLGVVLVTGGTGTFASLSVRESLELAAAAAGLGRADATTSIEEALARFPALRERLDVPARSLSGGERQMLELAQALVLRPRLLLVDELTRGLAPEAATALVEGMRALNAAGMTLVLVEQSVDAALEVARRAVFMDRGRIVFDGTPDELRRRPELLRSVFLAHAAEGLA